MTDEKLKWRLTNLVTEMVADKINQITGSHGAIVHCFLEDHPPEELKDMPTDVLKDTILRYIDDSGIWGSLE